MSKVCTQRLLVQNLRNEEDICMMIRHFILPDERDVYIAERLFSSSLVAVVSGASPRTLRIEHFKKVFELFSIKHLLTSIARELKYVGILTETAFEQCGWTERWVTSMIMIMIMIMIIMTPMTKHWNHADFLSSPHLDAIFNPPSAWWSAWRSPCTSTTSGTWRWQSQSNPNPIRHPGDPHNPGHASKSFRPAFPLNRLLPLLLGVSWYVSNL